MQSSSTNLIHCKAEAGGRKFFFFQYLLLFAILIFCIYQYSIYRIYGFSVYPDEFGYWASAAQWIGYDWSGVASLGYYYSFGYSLILVPVLWLFHDGVSAYRAAVAINMLLQCTSIGLLWGILRRLYCLSEADIEDEILCKQIEIRKMNAVFAVGVAVFYPAWAFYMQMTLSESLLTFLYVFICYQFVLLFEKPKMISIMLLSLSFLYIYFVHMRTVGVVLAGIAFLLLFMWKRIKNRKLLLAVTIILLVGAIGGVWLKNTVITTVYSSADAAHLAGNDYTGRLANLKGVFTAGGLLRLFQSCIGKLYYLGMASFGLFYPALFLCARRTAHFLRSLLARNKERKTERFSGEDGIYFFLLLSMIGQFLVSAIGAGGGGGRQDGLIYGRYNDYFLPVFIAIGIMELFESRHLIRNFLFNVGISTILFVITFLTALKNDSTIMYGFFATGLSYLAEDIYSYQVASEFPKAYLFGIFLMTLVMICIGIGRKMRQSALITGMIILTEILLMINLSQKYTWHFNDINYYDLKICEYIEDYEKETLWTEESDAESGMPVSYLYSGGNQYIDLIQFAMPDRTIEIYKEPDDYDMKKSWKEIEENLPQKGFLIADYGSSYLTELEEKYEKCADGSSFVLFMAK